MSLEPTKKMTLSVTKLVEFACRSGDLVLDAPAGPSAMEGIRAHQQLQKKRPEHSLAEYAFKLKVPELFSGTEVTLGGRIDLVHPKQDLHCSSCLEEIKTTYVSVQYVPEELIDRQWAQLKVYGFCYLLEQFSAEDVLNESIDLKLTWFNLKQKKSESDQRSFDYSELALFTYSALKRYIGWFQTVESQKAQSSETAKELAFPYEYRLGQRELAVNVYRNIRDKASLMVEAPTGLGKSLSVTFPAVKALGEGLIDQMVYVTAKRTGRQAAIQALDVMTEAGLQITSLELHARSDTCACQTGVCERDDQGICPFTEGFYDRLPDARNELLASRRITTDKLKEVSAKYRLCTFELGIQMLPWVSAVICDFNYVFDPLVALVYFDENQSAKALMVDESHNLSDRSRDMFSGQLNTRDCYLAASLVKPISQVLHKDIHRLANKLGEHAKQALGVNSESYERYENCQSLKSISRAAEKILATLMTLDEGRQGGFGGGLPERFIEWLKEIYRYLAIAELAGEAHYVVWRRIKGGSFQYDKQNFLQDSQQKKGLNEPQQGSLLDVDTIVSKRRKAPTHRDAYELKLFCSDASQLLSKSYKRYQSICFFSATLRPASYYQSVLAFPTDGKNMTLQSPFKEENVAVFLCHKLSTRYQDRDSTLSQVSDMIVANFLAKQGNYIAFFPSYVYMEQVFDDIQNRYPEVQLVKQKGEFTEAERAEFIAQFASSKSRMDAPLLGMAIMGGVFAEGVDFKGDALIGAMIVGVGLPFRSIEQELIRTQNDSNGYFSSGNGSLGYGSLGYDYAYRYPGMTRVLQTAGRVIRSEDDRGTILLIDDRFKEPFYQQLFPNNWRPRYIASSAELTREAAKFWDEVTLY